MAGLKLPTRRSGQRKKTVEADLPVVGERAGAKNKPTPKRSAAVAARPVEPYLKGTGRATGGTRKENAKSDRERRRGSLDAQRAAMKGEGDLSKMPARDARPEAAFTRAYVDKRRNLVTLILFAYALLFLNFIFKGQYIIITLMLAIVFLAIVDAFVLGFTVKRMVRKEFPGSKEKVSLYAIQRATMPRRFRLPRQGVGTASRR